MSVDFGTDTTSFLPDGTMGVDLNAPPISGARVPLEGWVRVIATQLGVVSRSPALGVSHPIHTLQNSSFTDTEFRGIEAEYAAAGPLQVYGITRVSCRLSRVARGKGVSLAAVLNLSDGSVQPLRVTAGDAITVLFPGST
jgi:hypothetical protein